MYICSWNGAIFVQGTFKRWRRKTHKADRNIIIFSFLQKVDPKCLEFMQTSYLVHACILTNVRRQPTRLWLLRDFAESDFTFSLQFDATTGQEATGGYKNGHVCFANILCKDFTFYAKWSCRMAPTKKMKIITYILERTKHSNAIKMEKKTVFPTNICFQYHPKISEAHQQSNWNTSIPKWFTRKEISAVREQR